MPPLPSRNINFRNLTLSGLPFCGWAFLALLRQRGADFVIRLHQGRRVQLPRRGSRQEVWRRPQRQGRATRWFWRALPRELTVRLVRFTVHPRGFRSHEVIVVTSLLDRKKFPDRAIAPLYGQRWQVELNFRQIKTSLSLDVLRGLSPAVVERELWMHAIAYNLIRALLLESAISHDRPISRLSFKGAIDAICGLVHSRPAATRETPPGASRTARPTRSRPRAPSPGT